MSDLDEPRIDHGPQVGEHRRPPQLTSEDPRRPRPPARWPWIVIVLVAVAAIAYFVWFRQASPPEVVAEQAGEAPSSRADDADVAGGLVGSATDTPLPELEASDPLVRQLVGRLSSHPALVEWLATPELVRAFTVVVENIAVRSNPARHLAFLAPEGEFVVDERDGVLTISDDSYHRYDLATTVFTSLDPQGCAAAYRRLKPLIEEAFADLGYPRQAFEPTLAQAISNILAIRVPATPRKLERGISNFSYSDPEVETLSALEKQMLRLGPDNASRIQEHLRKLATALELDL